MTDITVTNITNGVIDGTGVFDQLMKATNAHIQNEYSKNRILATDYSALYLGAIQAAMSTSLQFVLQEQQSEAQAALLIQQKLNLIDELDTAIVNRSLITAQETKLVGADTASVVAQTNLTDAQTTKLAGVDSDKAIAESSLISTQELKLSGVDSTLVTAQTTKLGKETNNLEAEYVNIAKQGAILDAQENNLISENKVIELQDDKIGAEIAKINAETSVTHSQGSLIDAQRDTEEGNTSLTYNKAKAIEATYSDTFFGVPVGGTLGATRDKTKEEEELLKKKVISENAQTVDTTTGVLGAQIQLYKKQKDGFDRDAEQKATKILADVYSVQRSTAESLAPPSGMDFSASTSAANKMLSGIGA